MTPAVTLAVAGATVIAVSLAVKIVTVALAAIPDIVAVTVVEPTAMLETWPAVVAAFETLAMFGSVTAHATWVVRIWVVPFWYVPVATSEALRPRTKDSGLGVIAMLVRGEAAIVKVALAVTPERVA